MAVPRLSSYQDARPDARPTRFALTLGLVHTADVKKEEAEAMKEKLEAVGGKVALG